MVQGNANMEAVEERPSPASQVEAIVMIENSPLKWIEVGQCSWNPIEAVQESHQEQQEPPQNLSTHSHYANKVLKERNDQLIELLKE